MHRYYTFYRRNVNYINGSFPVAEYFPSYLLVTVFCYHRPNDFAAQDKTF